MKKLFTAILLVCAFMSIGTLNASAQKSNSKKPAKAAKVAEASLQGTWATSDVSSLLGDEAALMMKSANASFKFGASDFSLLFDVLVTPDQDGMSMEMGVKFVFKGTYSKQNNSLFLKPDPESLDIDIYKFSINLPEEQKAAMKAMGITEESLKAMIVSGVKKDKMLTTMSDSFSKPLTIAVLTATTLAITDETGKTLTFTRQ